MRTKLFIWGLMLAGVGPAFSAMLYLEDFDDGANGWTDRDAGEMTVSHDAGNEWMDGSYGASFLPQTDAFSGTGSNFTGDYSGNGLTQISFQLYSDDVLPSDLFFRIIDGANIFSYQFSSINNLNSWQTFTVDLQWSFGWSGTSEAAFNSALTSVDSLEIQLTRNGTGAQSYYLDNIQTLDTEIGAPGAPGTVPEPAAFSLFALGSAMIFGLRRFLARA